MSGKLKPQLHSATLLFEWLQPLLCFAVLSSLVVCDSLHPMDCSLPGSSVHGCSPGKNTRVGCHAFLQSTTPATLKKTNYPEIRQ